MSALPAPAMRAAAAVLVLRQRALRAEVEEVERAPLPDVAETLQRCRARIEWVEAGRRRALEATLDCVRAEAAAGIAAVLGAPGGGAGAVRLPESLLPDAPLSPVVALHRRGAAETTQGEAAAVTIDVDPAVVLAIQLRMVRAQLVAAEGARVAEVVAVLRRCRARVDRLEAERRAQLEALVDDVRAGAAVAIGAAHVAPVSPAPQVPEIAPVPEMATVSQVAPVADTVRASQTARSPFDRPPLVAGIAPVTLAAPAAAQVVGERAPALPVRANVAMLTLQVRALRARVEAAERALAPDGAVVVERCRARIERLEQMRQRELSAIVESVRLEAAAGLDAARAEAAAAAVAGVDAVRAEAATVGTARSPFDRPPLPYDVAPGIPPLQYAAAPGAPRIVQAQEVPTAVGLTAGAGADPAAGAGAADRFPAATPAVAIDPDVLARAIVAAFVALGEQRGGAAGPWAGSWIDTRATEKRGFWASAWHADVVLSVVAMLIVLIVLLAWST